MNGGIWNYEEVAEVYRKAGSSGTPSKAVAEHFGISISAAACRVMRARCLGLLEPAPRPSTSERFFSKVRMTDTCWLWTGYLNPKGYGTFGYRGGMALAHRVAYEQMAGPIPDGKEIDHLCRNRACVRPDHLEPVTRRENQLRGNTIAARNASRTHCPQGHPYSGDNLYLHSRQDRERPARDCLTCKRASNRRSAKRQREAS